MEFDGSGRSREVTKVMGDNGCLLCEEVVRKIMDILCFEAHSSERDLSDISLDKCEHA